MADSKKEQRGMSRFALATIAAGFLGALIGVGVFTVGYAEATSYFGSEPEACINCHVMNEQYDAWQAGSHSNVATCSDCHLPHDGVVSQYLVKAEDGVLHASKFTLGTYPENIVIRDKSLEIANASCLHCHTDLTQDMMFTMGADDDELSCVRCHTGVGHE